MASLALKNRHLIGLCTWLQGLSLAGKESRERTRFVELCIPRIAEMEKLKEELIDKYCEKNDDGTRKTIERAGRQVWSFPGTTEFECNKEWADIENEEFLIDLLDGNISKVKTVRDLVLNTDYKFGPSVTDPADEHEAKARLAQDYEQWCVAFEAFDM